MSKIAGFAILVTLAAPGSTWAQPPAVSPGDRQVSRPIDQPCPTFSWGLVDNASAYELAVYRIGQVGEDPDLVLHREIAGSAFSWTPSLEHCLQRGLRYAWSVRALGEAVDSRWSEPSFFEVPAAPSEHDLEQALATVKRYMAQGGLDLQRGPSHEHTTAESSGSASGKGEDRSAVVRTGSPGAAPNPTLMHVAGNIEAQSFSGDGAALTNLDWNNLTNVPTGLDDGDDVVTYQAGNLLKLTGTVFNVTDGGASGLDADLLDGFQGSAYARRADTYTKTEVDALLAVDNIQAPLPPAPERPRLEGEPRFPGMRRLAWGMPSFSGVGAFAIYQAGFPITDGNKGGALRTVSAGPFVAVNVFPASGLQHFRVEAMNVLGDAGPLSPELVIDTTSRLAYLADQRADAVDELFVAPASGGGATVVSPSSPLPTADVERFAWSPDGSRLAYRADQDVDEVFELYVVSADGGSATKVNDKLVPGGDVAGLAWSPDGSRLVYAADQDTDGVYELYVVSASGGSVTKVNDALGPDRSTGLFAWSPDGSRIAYMADADADNVPELYAVAATGGGATKLNDTLESDRYVLDFAWSPDGTRVAYLANQDKSDVVELYVARAGGGGSTKLNDALVLNGNVDYTVGLNWSPDGSRLLYRADQDTDEVYELYAVPATGGGATKVNDPLVTGGDVDFDFAWSPDGSRVAYVADQDTDDVWELYVVSAAGGSAIEVSSAPESLGHVDRIAWSPDGSRIAYDARQDSNYNYELYVVPAMGGIATKVNDPLVTGGKVLSFAWSPDGSRLVYRADQETDEVFELYVVAATGGGATKINDALVTDGDTHFSLYAWSPLGAD